MQELSKITDAIGTYEAPMNPIGLMDAHSIYINLFHNENQKNSNEWKVTLSVYDENGTRETYTAGILNKFEPARWFRNIPQQYREKDFYQDFLKHRHTLKGFAMDKPASAGFFYSNSIGHESPYNTAYAYMHKEKDEIPMVGIRMWDFYWFGEMPVNEYKKGKGPDYSAIIIEKPKKGMIDGWA